jgi:hypothetical protein
MNLVDFPYQLAADGVLVTHAALVAFVVGGLVVILLGNLRGWSWVNAPLFRIAHLAAIAAVVLEAWFGITCPLTAAERWLRTRAGVSTYQESFIEHWLEALLFYQGPPWLFTLCYTVFGLAVALTWWAFPPRSRRDRRHANA